MNVIELSTTIDPAQVPTNPTFSRDARFVFGSSQGAFSFECALNGAEYAPCSSEQAYTGLVNGLHTFLVRGVNGDNRGAPARHVWRVQNVAPSVAEKQLVSTRRDTAIEIALTAVDNEPITFELVDSPANGSVQLIAPTVVKYTPDSGFSGVDSFTFRASDGQEYSNLGTVDVQVNSPPVFPNDPITLAVQYSDYVTPTTVTASDPDADDLTFSQVGLPAGLSLWNQECKFEELLSTCTVEIVGTVEAPAGTYAASLSVSDGQITTTQGITVVVTVEDSTVAFEGDNPTAVQVTAPESNASQPFELVVYVEDLEPDAATYQPAAGDIPLANVSMTLVPVGPGSPVPGHLYAGSDRRYGERL